MRSSLAVGWCRLCDGASTAVPQLYKSIGGYSGDSGSSLAAILNVSWRARRPLSLYGPEAAITPCRLSTPAAHRPSPRSNDTVHPSIIPTAAHMATVPDDQQRHHARSSPLVRTAIMIYRINLAYNFAALMRLLSSGTPGYPYLSHYIPRN